MKRIAAIVLPDLACELARADSPSVAQGPFAVIVADEHDSDAPVDHRAVLDAVDPKARQYGVRPGQTAARASAYVGQLRVVRLTRARIRQALASVAEMALGFGTTAAIDLETTPEQLADGPVLARYPGGDGAGPHDTVWLDVSGCARLVGGEDLLCADLRERARELGHRARVAIASGPRIARAVARWASASCPPYADCGELVVPSGDEAAHIAELPIAALPLPDALGSWLLKLGLLRVDDLARLDRKRLSHRLGGKSRDKRKLGDARDLLELIAGRDAVPLRTLELPRSIVEHANLENELSHTEPLLFVLRGLTARAVARLTARGEACGSVSLRLCFDRSVIALANRQNDSTQLSRERRIDITLPVPMSRQEEIMRALQAKLERLELPAPVVALGLTLDDLCEKNHRQLSLTRGKTIDPNALPLLLAELGAWLGPTRLGVLSEVDSHRPEARSRLVPVDLSSAGHPHLRSSVVPTWDNLFNPEPTRILPEPIAMGASSAGHPGSSRLSTGSLIHADHNLFLVDRLRLSARIDRVEWWSPSPVSRDYARAWVRTNLQRHDQEQTEYGQAWMFVDRRTKRGFLHGWYE